MGAGNATVGVLPRWRVPQQQWRRRPAYSCPSSAGVTVEYCSIHDNFTHGWTTALNFYLDQGKAAGAMSVARGNTAFNNQEDPPIWRLPKFCAGQNSACTSAREVRIQANARTVRRRERATLPRRIVAGSISIPTTTQHPRAPRRRKDTACGPAMPRRSAQAASARRTGGPAPATPRVMASSLMSWWCANSGVLVENNVFDNNEGEGINIFRSDNVLVRNNVSWKNNIRPSNTEAAIFADPAHRR